MGKADQKQVDEIPNSGKISLGMSVIMRVSLRDGTYHEVGTTIVMRYTNLIRDRTSAMDISRTAKGKQQHLRKPRKKQQQMHSKELCATLAMCSEIVYTTRTTYKR
jgi:hypothetical protein